MHDHALGLVDIIESRIMCIISGESIIVEVVNTSDGPLFRVTLLTMAGENKSHSVGLARHISGGHTCLETQVLKWSLLSQGKEFWSGDLAKLGEIGLRLVCL